MCIFIWIHTWLNQLPQDKDSQANPHCEYQGTAVNIVGCDSEVIIKLWNPHLLKVPPMEIFVRMAQYTQFYSELSNKILGKRFSSAEYTYKCVGNSARYTGTQIIPSTSPSPFTMLGYLHIKCFFKSYC